MKTAKSEVTKRLLNQKGIQIRDQMEVQMELWEFAKRTTEANRIEIAPDCMLLLRNFIENGEKRIEKQQTWAPNRRLEATENLQRFLAEMIDEARRTGLTVLNERTFYYTKGKLCPLWPFC